MLGTHAVGKGLGRTFSAYSLCASKKSKASGVTRLAGFKVFACSVNVKIKTAGRGPQPPYSFDGPKEYAEKGLALRWALVFARFRCFFLSIPMASRAVLRGKETKGALPSGPPR